VGFSDQAKELLGKFKWGPHFITLNKELLDDYAQAEDSTDVVEVQKQYLDENCV